MNTHLPCNLELPRMVVRPSGQMTSSIILMQSMHMATSARLIHAYPLYLYLKPDS